MAPTFNQQLFDAMVRHQVGLLRFSSGVRTKVWKLLDATEADLRHQIEDRLRLQIGKPITPARQQRVQALLDGLKETRLKAWKDVNATWVAEMNALALAEPGFMAGMMATAIPVELGLHMPSTQRLAAIVGTKPFMGATLKQWADGESKADIARIHQQIRIGLVQGEGIPEISRRIVGSLEKNGSDGVTAKTRRNAEAITRTATNAIAAESRKALFEENKDLMSGELFTATLDSKTTPICRAYDGKVFQVGEPPDMPIHWNERSVRSPIVDGEVVGDRPYRAFSEQMLLREYAEQNGISPAPKKRDGLPRGTKGDYDAFAKKRMRELTGTVPAKTSYQEWLKGQKPELQDDILGPARGKLFREGGITLDKFVDDSGRQFTLEELGQFDKQAFEDAGLEVPEPPESPAPTNAEEAEEQAEAAEAAAEGDVESEGLAAAEAAEAAVEEAAQAAQAAAAEAAALAAEQAAVSAAQAAEAAQAALAAQAAQDAALAAEQIRKAQQLADAAKAVAAQAKTAATAAKKVGPKPLDPNSSLASDLGVSIKHAEKQIEKLEDSIDKSKQLHFPTADLKAKLATAQADLKALNAAMADEDLALLKVKESKKLLLAEAKAAFDESAAFPNSIVVQNEIERLEDLVLPIDKKLRAGKDITAAEATLKKQAALRIEELEDRILEPGPDIDRAILGITGPVKPHQDADYTEWLESLSFEERDVIRGWTSVGYTRIRAAQRGLYDDDVTEFGEAAKRDARIMTDALSRAPRRESTVYRGFGMPQEEFDLLGPPPGSWKLTANSSFSEDYTVAKGFLPGGKVEEGFVRVLAEVRMKRAGPNLSRSALTSHRTENEVVGLKGQQFKVISKTKVGDTWYVVFEEI